MERNMRKFYKVSYNDSGIIPTRADGGSAGHDFYAPADIVIKPHETVVVKTYIKAEMEKDFTPEEKEAIAHLDEILPRVKEYTRDMPDGTIITEPYYSDIPVGVMQRDVYDYYVAYIESMMAQAAE